MTIEQVIWTALPRDAEGPLRLSVHVAPRLMNADGSDTERQLGEFDAFVNWPERLAGLRFAVEFEDGPSLEAFPEEAADPNLWERIFPPDTPVLPHEFQDHAKRDLHVFPVRGVLQFLEETYGAVGAGGSTVPTIDDPTGPLGPFRPLENLTSWITDSQSFYEELYGAKEKGQKEQRDGRVVTEEVGSGLPPSQEWVANTFFQAYRFYYRPGSQRPDFPEDHVEPSPDVPEFDFHQRAALLADHPELLRKLGFVVDLVVELDEKVPAEGVVRVVPDGDLPEAPPKCPGTRYELDPPWFGAKPKSDFRMSRGVLRLSPEVFDLFQVDIDGAALQVIGFADTLARLRDPQRRSHATPDAATVPALRSAGLALARTYRGEALLEDLTEHRDKNALIESGHSVVFDAEDLVRGYRIDVHHEEAPDGPRWFSLHRRIAEHQVKMHDGEQPLPSIKVADEGYMKATSASGERVDHPEPSDDLYLHETVFGWEGWSLSVPRPGKRIVEPGEGDNSTSISRYHPDDDNPLPLSSQISVERQSLPRLRIGNSYRLRARTVDLAGNSRPFTEEDLEPPEPDLSSETEVYLRFEPVPSPAVLRRHLDTEGESLEHLVVRSNLGVDAAGYASSEEVKNALEEDGVPHSYAEDSQRHLAPPKGSQLMAEQHGMLEAAFGGSPSGVTDALRVSLKEEGTFLDEAIIDLATGQKSVAQTTISLHPPGAALPAERGAGLPGGAYAFYPDEDVMLPYLPDPLAVGVSLTGYDFTGAEVFHEVALFPGNWPELKPFRIRLSEHSGAPAAEFTDGILEVRLPKAEVVRARLSSVFPEGRLEDLAVWRWIPDTAKSDAFIREALQGRHWMLTPFRWMTFTHAVQQPLLVPDSAAVTHARSLGSTFAQFRGPITNHAKSTGRLDVFGEWTEDIDLVTDDEPRMRAFGTEVHHRAQAFGFDVGPDEDAAEVMRPTIGRVSRHEFGDTKHRRIVYKSIATTRFREFLPRPIADDPVRIQRVEETTDGTDVKSALIHHIESSARPAAPDVLYSVPTMRWERDGEGDHRVHVRRGKAVRVWLRRPWFSSGDDEQLAVVLEPGIRLPPDWVHLAPFLELPAAELARRPAYVSRRPLEFRTPPAARRLRPDARAGELAASAPSSAVSSFDIATVSHTVTSALSEAPSQGEIKRMLRPYVTEWGSDPVWQSALPDRPPTVAAFPRHVGYAAGLTLEELPSAARVVAAAHEVHFDRDRKLWYCDIEVNPGNTYFPFVRLALARYQPYSVPNAHLSRVVMTDFIQLLPDRRAELQLSESVASITVRGFSGRNVLAEIVASIPKIDVPLPAGSSPNTTMRVTLDRRIDGIDGDLGWEPTGQEITLNPSVSGFHATWTGSLKLPSGAIGEGRYRVVVTEVETYLRDLQDGDPMVSTSPLDFVRERVVYADVFEV